MDAVKSVNNVTIRLTPERWMNITENHEDVAGYYDEVLNAIESPDFVIAGYNEALIALRQIETKFLAAVYKSFNKYSFSPSQGQDPDSCFLRNGTRKYRKKRLNSEK